MNSCAGQTCLLVRQAYEGERLPEGSAGGRVAGKTDKPKDYEPSTDYRFSCNSAAFFGNTAALPLAEAARAGAHVTGEHGRTAASLRALRAASEKRKVNVALGDLTVAQRGIPT
jgi:hypothetical protein